MTWVCRLVTGWRNSAAIGVGNTAFESTINGESAFAGETTALGRSKSSPIIEGNEHDQEWDASDSSGRNLAQAAYDLRSAEREAAARIQREVLPRAAT